VNQRRVVITGVGPVTPIGIGVTDFWNALLEGRSAVRRIQAFDPAEFSSQVGSEIDSLNVSDYVPKQYRKAGKIMARDIVLAAAAAHQAAMDAGLRTRCILERGDAAGERNLDSTRFGANIGAGLICADLAELSEALAAAAVDGKFDITRWGAEGMSNLTPLWLLKFLPNMLACHVTIVHDAQGPSNTITCGEASSHLAIGEAFRTIARGVADVCICGGAESKANPMALMRQVLGGRLSTRSDAPQSACRPFGTDRDGTVTSEGGGLVILEELSHARARGARIYCEVVGFGAAHDAYSATQPTTPHPEGRGILTAMRKALRDAGVQPGQIDALATAAAGLPAHDAAEAAAIRGLLGAHAARPALLNIRGGLGTNGAGSGAIDFIAAVLAMHNATIPPMVNGAHVDAALSLPAPPRTPVDARIECALSTGYALGGGQCAAIVIRRLRD